MMKKKLKKDQMLFDIFGGFIVGILALACFIPFVLIVSGSFSAESEIITKGYSLIPRSFSLDAYRAIFKDTQGIAYGYRNTIFYTAVGTAGGLFFTAMTGYVLSRKYFPWRNILAFFIYFTTLFSAGLVPSYLWNVQLGMKNTIWVLIIPGMLSMFNIFIMRNYMATIPDAISESGKIDGANDFVIFSRLIFPLSKPVLATVGLFLALSYWNAWYNCNLYVNDPHLFTLQYNLYKVLNEAATIEKMLEQGANVATDLIPPAETVKLAMMVVTTGPILLLYPYVQKYFVKGITIGAVKG